MLNKICSGAEAVKLVKSGDFLCMSGNMNSAMPEELMVELEKRFLETGEPKNLTIMSGSGVGDMGPVTTKGFQHLAHEGLIKRVIVGHYGSNNTIMEMVINNKVESYNLPQGVCEHMFRRRAQGQPGEISKIGLKTYVDPRLEGGKMNSITKEDLVRLINLDGEEYLYYPMPKINIGCIRATTADENGNLSFEEEAAYVNARVIAMATRASGGILIAQVKNIVCAGAIPAKDVHVAGVFVDKIVVCQDVMNNHRQTMGDFYNAAYTGRYKVPVPAKTAIPLGADKVIARRAAAELIPNALVNLGLGIPESVSSVVAEEGLSDSMVMTVETGALGGIPAPRFSFGASINAWSHVDSPTIFDVYDGGDLDMTFVGMAEIGENGDVNVSRFGPKITGCGGFIDLTQGTRKVVFCGTLTSGGFKAAIEDGKVKILQEGKNKKFVKKVYQVTFSGEHAIETGQEILYVTERCVFRLTPQGLRIVEVAPGIDIERDVLPHMDFKPLIADDLKVMDDRFFREAKIGLAEMIGGKK